MPTQLLGLITVIIIALITVSFGLILARRKGGKEKLLLPHLISIGAGILIALCFVEYLPRSFKAENAPLLITLGFLVVIFTDIFIAPKLGSHQKCTHGQKTDNLSLSHKAACSSIGCILVCAFFDGMEIPAAFAIAPKTGFLVSTGIILHAIPEGAVAASLGLAGGLSSRSTRINVALVGLAMLLGGLVSVTALRFIPFETVILPFFTGILIYVSIGHLLPGALRSKKGLAGILMGFGLILSISYMH